MLVGCKFQMYYLMLLQIALRIKGFPTDLATVRFLSSMDSLVTVNSRRSGKHLVTEVTGIELMATLYINGPWFWRKITMPQLLVLFSRNSNCWARTLLHSTSRGSSASSVCSRELEVTGSIPGRDIPKLLKIVLAGRSLLSTQTYRVWLGQVNPVSG